MEIFSFLLVLMALLGFGGFANVLVFVLVSWRTSTRSSSSPFWVTEKETKCPPDDMILRYMFQ